MKAKILVYALPALIFATIHLAQAQQPKKIPRIGYLTSSGRSSFEAFATALRQLGYVEGKSVIFEFRTTENTAQLQPELAAMESTRSKPGATMERKPSGGTRIGSATSFYGGEQRRQIRGRVQRSN